MYFIHSRALSDQRLEPYDQWVDTEHTVQGLFRSMSMHLPAWRIDGKTGRLTSVCVCVCVCVCVWLWDLQAKINALLFQELWLGLEQAMRVCLLFWEDGEVGFSALLYLIAQVGIKWPLHRTKGPLIKNKQWRETSKVSEQSGRGLSIFYSSVYLSII